MTFADMKCQQIKESIGFSLFWAVSDFTSFGRWRLNVIHLIFLMSWSAPFIWVQNDEINSLYKEIILEPGKNSIWHIYNSVGGRNFTRSYLKNTFCFPLQRQRLGGTFSVSRQGAGVAKENKTFLSGSINFEIASRNYFTRPESRCRRVLP